MNKIVVGAAPSPNLLSAQSRIGSLANTKHRVRLQREDSWEAGELNICFQPGGGNVKIENRKLDWNTQARTKAINEKYTPGGGDVKVWRVERVSSLIVLNLSLRLRIVS